MLIKDLSTEELLKRKKELEILGLKRRVLEFAKVIEDETDIEEARIDITKNYIRIRIKEPSEFVEDSFKTIILSKKDNIKTIIGKLKSDPNGSTHIQAVLFSKDTWDKNKAKKWVKDNKNLGQVEESNYEMEEAKLSFNWDNETIARLLYETECPTCKMKGWNDVLSIDFENSKVKSKCPGCGGINEYDLTPTATIIKKGKKPEVAKMDKKQMEDEIKKMEEKMKDMSGEEKDKMMVKIDEMKKKIKEMGTEELNKNISKEGGSNIVEELIKKHNKATIEELSTFIDETLVSLSTKDIEIASLKTEKEVSAKSLMDSKLETENAKLELEKIKGEFATVQTELASIRQAEKEAIVKARKEDLGPEFLASLTDEDILNDLKFENAKLKKQLKQANVKPVTAGLEAGAATDNVVDPVFLKQKAIHDSAYPELK